MSAASTKRSQHSQPPRPASAGFAIIATIWAIGVMSVLATAAIVGARYRASNASSQAATLGISLAAESAVNVAIALLLQEPGGLHAVAARFPLRCRLPGGETAFIALEDEAGKIDLNAAKPQLLSLLFSRLTGSVDEGARLANRIVQFRQSPSRQRAPPMNAPAANVTSPIAPLQGGSAATSNSHAGNFVSILQLDQIEGMSSELFHAARPFVTVHSGLAEPSPSAVPARLRRLLSLPALATGPSAGSPGQRNFTVRADVTSHNEARFVRQAVVSFEGGARPFVIHEWQRGDVDEGAEPVHAPVSHMASCLQIEKSR